MFFKKSIITIFILLTLFLNLSLIKAQQQTDNGEILNCYPNDGQENISIDSKIKIFFNNEIKPSDYSFTFSPYVEGKITTYQNALIFTPLRLLKKSTKYKVMIVNKKDNSYYSFSFITKSNLPKITKPDEDTLGGIKLRDNISKVIAILGEPEDKTEPLSGIEDTLYSSYIYKRKGIRIDIILSNNIWIVYRISTSASCKEGTSRGIKIGDSENKVRENYVLKSVKHGNMIDDDGSSLINRIMYCGSVYHGIEFRFDINGNVKSIAIGGFSE